MCDVAKNEIPDNDVPNVAHATMDEYRDALKAFDACVCEAVAVGQAIGVQMALPHIGYATHVFARVNAHAISMVRAAPKSRWTKSDADNWEFSAVAGHTRSIIEGALMLHYVIKEPVSPDEWLLRLNVMHLHDCCRRLKILDGVVGADQVEGLTAQAEEIKERLRSNPVLATFDAKGQRRLLSGDQHMAYTRDALLDELGWERKPFYMLWNLLSQYTHVLPVSFYRMEPNGRGTGLNNDFDRSYIRMALVVCETRLRDCVDLIVGAFPEAAEARKGLDSKFSPGPMRNVPRERRRKRS